MRKRKEGSSGSRRQRGRCKEPGQSLALTMEEDELHGVATVNVGIHIFTY